MIPVYVPPDLRGLVIVGVLGVVFIGMCCAMAAADAVLEYLQRDDEQVPDDRAMDVVTDAMRPERWQDEACAMTAPDPLDRLDAEMDLYLKKEHN